MPELATLLRETVGGVIAVLDASEKKHLLAHVEAVKGIGSSEVGEDQLVTLLEEGWLPDFMAAASVNVRADLSMTTGRERTTNAGGSVNLGPLSITGSFTDKMTQGTTTNLSVTVEFTRRSASAIISAARDSLRS